jgi:hypothetical protein
MRCILYHGASPEEIQLTSLSVESLSNVDFEDIEALKEQRVCSSSIG